MRRAQRLVGFRVKTVLTVLIMLFLVACSDKDARTLRWNLAVSQSNLDRAVFINARILGGGCRGSSVFYNEEVPATGAFDVRPPVLSSGNYGFDVRLRDADCLWFAQGCTDVSLPRTDGSTVLVNVNAISAIPNCNASECNNGDCSGFIDAGVDSSSQTQNMGDGG